MKMYVPRLNENLILKYLTQKRKIVLILGPRQVGKTTLSHKLIEKLNLKTKKINADYPEYHSLFEKLNFADLQSIAKNTELLFIDEAHQLPNIHKALKILYDEYPNLKILVTGSSSLNLTEKISEPLTGRKSQFIITPFTLKEIQQFYNYDTIQIRSLLNQILIYGLYPEVFLEPDLNEKVNLLLEISHSYLFKDLFAMAWIKYPQKLIDLTKYLAIHIGQPISINELADTLSLNHDTIERYLDLLQKTYVIFKLPIYSGRFRNVLKKKSKYYFYDVGIRNALLKRFTPLTEREDVGALWENFIIAEKIKLALLKREIKDFYYWRNYEGAEIDLIEIQNNKISAFEIKLKKSKKYPPRSWQQAIKNYDFYTINLENFTQHLL